MLSLPFPGQNRKPRCAAARLALLAIFAAGCLAGRAHAQASAATDPEMSPAANQTEWPLQERPAGLLAIDLVTTTEPGLRHKCRVHRITATEVVCGVGPLRHPVVYPRKEVAAIILPPTHSARLWAWLEVGGGAALLAGSLFVPVTWVAVLMQVGAGFSPFAALGTVFDDDDHSDDRVAYQRPDTPLTVQLRH